MNRRTFTARLAAAFAAPLALLGRRRAEAKAVEPRTPPGKDLEQRAAEWVYAEMRQYDEFKRSSGQCGSDLTWGDTSKSVDWLAKRLRERTEQRLTVPFYTGLMYWVGESAPYTDRLDPEPVFYEATFHFLKSGCCSASICFGKGVDACGTTTWFRGTA